ncbi:MAG: hypothetical protein LBQ88_06965 [Treponema sp.]|jgi:Na+/melibiose symporter-like transporter|nr:hypothetical protein [Treponema sp.]
MEQEIWRAALYGTSVFILLAVIPTLMYPLTPEKNAEIRARLQAKIKTAD